MERLEFAVGFDLTDAETATAKRVPAETICLLKSMHSNAVQMLVAYQYTAELRDSGWYELAYLKAKVAVTAELISMFEGKEQ